jgi:hypothetical protein
VAESLPLVVRAAAPLPRDVNAEPGELQAAHRDLTSAVTTAWATTAGAVEASTSGTRWVSSR